jgi:hypothetical protein
MRWQAKEQTKAENIHLVCQQTCFGKRCGLVLFDHHSNITGLCWPRMLGAEHGCENPISGHCNKSFHSRRCPHNTREYSHVYSTDLQERHGDTATHSGSWRSQAYQGPIINPDNLPHDLDYYFQQQKADGRIKIPLQFGLGWLKGWAYGARMPAF